MAFLATLSQILLLALSVFLMIIVLLQRGRGGGLAGAFGGAGGQSAFGTKAGDVFTWITSVTAGIWILIAGSSGLLLRAVADGTRAEDLGDVTTIESTDTGLEEGDDSFDPTGSLSIDPPEGATASDDSAMDDSAADSESAAAAPSTELDTDAKPTTDAAETGIKPSDDASSSTSDDSKSDGGSEN